jgi:hypothetical protein
MSEISINTPALLFPAISLMMLAYTNRFYAIASRVRSLHDDYEKSQNQENVFKQIKNLKRRLNMIRNMQALAVFSFLSCTISMFLIYRELHVVAAYLFGLSLFSLVISLLISLAEIFISTKALELELSDLTGLEKGSLLNIFKRE